MIESELLFGKIDLDKNAIRKGLTAIYRQEIIQDVTSFTSQSAVAFCDKLFTELDFILPGTATRRLGFPGEEKVRFLI